MMRTPSIATPIDVSSRAKPRKYRARRERAQPFEWMVDNNSCVVSLLLLFIRCEGHFAFILCINDNSSTDVIFLKLVVFDDRRFYDE